jgi:hypothetical protein
VKPQQDLGYKAMRGSVAANPAYSVKAEFAHPLNPPQKDPSEPNLEVMSDGDESPLDKDICQSM